MLKNFFRRKKNDEESIDLAVGLSADFDSLSLRQSKVSTHVPLDFGILFVVMSLLLLGTVMVYSASISLSDAPKFNVTPEYFLIRHLISIGVAVILASIAFRFSMSFCNTVAPLVFVFGIVLLVLVLIPGIGKVTNGSARWIPLPFFSLQVTEVMKIAALLYAANFTVRKQCYMHSFKKGFLPMGVTTAIVAVLVLSEPDLGALFMIVIISFGVLFLGGLSYSLLLWSGVVVVATICFQIIFNPWRMARFLAYLDPWSGNYALGKGYQLSHSLIAFGRGEATGVGLGDAIEKQHYLPEAHTDFIMAIIGEELGFIGVCLVLVLFTWLIRRCFEIGRKAIILDQFFSGLVAQGVAIWFGTQAFINVGVASGLLPTKGLTLPFISFGGSAMVSGLVAIAFVLRVDYENKLILRGGV